MSTSLYHNLATGFLKIGIVPIYSSVLHIGIYNHITSYNFSFLFSLRKRISHKI